MDYPIALDIVLHMEIILNMQLNSLSFQIDLFFKIWRSLVVKHLRTLKGEDNVSSTERAMHVA